MGGEGGGRRRRTYKIGPHIGKIITMSFLCSTVEFLGGGVGMWF